jgi:hypothetical protein
MGKSDVQVGNQIGRMLNFFFLKVILESCPSNSFYHKTYLQFIVYGEFFNSNCKKVV